MEIRVCPDCDKAFYALRDVIHLVCHHCGYSLLDRRIKERTLCNLDFTFTYKSKNIKATLKDYSESGARIVYKERSLPVDSILKVTLDKLNTDSPAITVWTRSISRSLYSSGFKFISRGKRK
jgi:DNA-directed RNA polymerase subunit RPC12/RpoP